ncbi:MAG: hypothetical protein ACTHJ8_02385, partial [Mucilaginibacter sp.]
MIKLKIIGGLALIVLVMIKCQKSAVFPTEQYDDQLSGGDVTVFDATSKAFQNAFPALSEYDGRV